MSTNEIKRIAESVFPDLKISENDITGDVLVRPKKGGHSEVFNPYEIDADAFKVLDALYKKGWNIEFDKGCLFIDNDMGEFGALNIVAGNLKEAIYRAYLSVIGDSVGL